MSDVGYLAVGGVSAVLRAMLSSALTQGGPSTILGSTAGITATSPDLITTGAEEQAQLNLFMYYVSLNPALRNIDLPSTNGQGTRLGNPPLALNLHYLISAYGAAQFDPEILLVWAMKVFHDTPVVPKGTIADALAALTGDPGPAGLLADSTLAEQIEHLRITPETLTTEEIYRLWTAFQTAYRPSTALQVSVVVIQDTESFTSNQPPKWRHVSVQPLQTPVISSVSPSMAAAGQQLTITGNNFLGDAPADTLVSFDSASAIAADLVLGNTIKVTLPGDLQAGTRTLRVQRNTVFGNPAVTHRGFSSNPAAFQLIPTIQTPAPVAATAGATLALSVSPAFGPAQQVTLFIGDGAIPIDQRAPGSASTTTLSFPLPAGLATGSFPIRVEIDGAQSALTFVSGVGFTPQVQVSA
ncbi:MAG: DUF4255 domain-containing protein [Solirubrobacteraceae bacterium]|jgi:hypothetical protein